MLAQAYENRHMRNGVDMLKFLVWLVLLVIAWPLALPALILYPILWLVSLPLRIVAVSLKAVLDLFKAIIRLPARVLRGPRAS